MVLPNTEVSALPKKQVNMDVPVGPCVISLIILKKIYTLNFWWKVMGSYFLDARSMSLWPSKFPKTECLLDFGDMSP